MPSRQITLQRGYRSGEWRIVGTSVAIERGRRCWRLAGYDNAACDWLRQAKLTDVSFHTLTAARNALTAYASIAQLPPRGVSSRPAQLRCTEPGRYVSACGTWSARRDGRRWEVRGAGDVITMNTLSNCARYIGWRMYREGGLR